MDAEISFGHWIKKRRKALDLTRDELAQSIGCSVSALRKIETDERRPSKQLAELMAGALSIPGEEHDKFMRIARGELPIGGMKSTVPIRDLSLIHPQKTPIKSIPNPPTPLIGREAELAVIHQMLEDPQCRLVTLVGPGGIGKTRLALEVALNQSGDAFFVSLASTSSPSFIAPAIADALGCKVHNTSDPRAQLLDHLSEKQIFLVLDNMEHLLDDIGIISEIMQYAPHIKILCTSREPLTLRGEWVFDVGGLIIPAPSGVEEMETYGAAALFIQSARQVNALFTTTPDDRPAIARICQLVEGNPLGIELAASWARVLSCPEIAREIEGNLDFLSTSMRDLPERHRSLQAVFDHSWRLLTEQEQRSLSGLTVFRGGFTSEAAEQVSGASLKLLAGLVTKSLVHRVREGRYDLHLLVRQYAEAKVLRDDGVRQAHSDHYLLLLEKHRDRLRTAQLFEARDFLAGEAANIHEAWQWVVQRQDLRRMRESAFNLIDMHDWLYWYPEGKKIFTEAAALVQSQPSAVSDTTRRPEYACAIGALLLGRDVFSFRLGQPHPDRDLFTESLEFFHAGGDEEAQAYNLEWLGNMLYKRGDYAAAIRRLRQGLVLHRKRKDSWGQAVTLNLLAVTALHAGRYSTAQHLLEQALTTFRNYGNPIMVIIVLINLGRVFRLQNNYDKARALFEESFSLSRAIGDGWSIGTCLDFLGQLALEKGNYDEAQQKFEQALKEFRDIGDWWSRLRIMINLGWTDQSRADLAGARQIFLEALRSAHRAGFVPRIIEALIGIAAVWSQTGWQEPAIEILDLVRAQDMTPQETRDQAERLYTELAAQLTAGQIEEIHMRTQAKTIGGMVQEILESPDNRP